MSNFFDRYHIANFTCFVMSCFCLYLYTMRGFNYLVLAFIFYLMYNLLVKKEIGSFQLDTEIYKYVCIFLLCMALSAVFSMSRVNVKDTFLFIVWALPLPMFIYLHNQANINKGLRYALEVVIVAGFILSLHDYFILDINRPSGLMYNSALWSSCMGFLLPLFCYGFLDADNNWRKWLRLGICIIILANIILAASRGIILGILVVVLGVALRRLYVYSKCYTLTCITALIILGIFFYPELFKLISRGYDNNRLLAWQASLDMFTKHPLLGVGLMQWKQVFASQYMTSSVKETLPHAHNMYLGFLSTTGLLGFLGLCYFLFGWIKFSTNELRKGDKYYLAVLAGIGIFLLHGLVDNVIVVSLYHKVFWFFVAIYQWNILRLPA